MAQEVRLMGATYSGVPAVRLPDSNGTLHRFDDCSVVTAEAPDVTEGKIFVAADGTITTGTGQGGGIDGDNLAYGLSLVGSAIVGQSVVS